MSYTLQYTASVAVAILLAMIGSIQLADPVTLGLSPKIVAWTQILVPGLGILAGVLPSLRRPPAARDNTGPASNPDPLPRDR